MPAAEPGRHWAQARATLYGSCTQVLTVCSALLGRLLVGKGEGLSEGSRGVRERRERIGGESVPITDPFSIMYRGKQLDNCNSHPILKEMNFEKTKPSYYAITLLSVEHLCLETSELLQ
jgi:hypothetical protein